MMEMIKKSKLCGIIVLALGALCLPFILIAGRAQASGAPPDFETDNVLSEQNRVTEGNVWTYCVDGAYSFGNEYERQFFFGEEADYYTYGGSGYVRTENAELTALSKVKIEIGAFGSPQESWHGAGFIFRSDGTNRLSVRFLGSTMLLMHNGDTLETVTLGKAIAEGDILDVCVLSEPDSASVWLDGILVVEDEPIAYRYPNRAGFWIIHNAASFSDAGMWYDRETLFSNPEFADALAGQSSVTDGTSVFHAADGMYSFQNGYETQQFFTVPPDYYTGSSGNYVLSANKELTVLSTLRITIGEFLQPEQNWYGAGFIFRRDADGFLAVRLLDSDIILMRSGAEIARKPMGKKLTPGDEVSLRIYSTPSHTAVWVNGAKMFDQDVDAAFANRGALWSINNAASFGSVTMVYDKAVYIGNPDWSSEARLAKITLDGEDIPGFDSDKTDYVLTFDYDAVFPDESAFAYETVDKNASAVLTLAGNRLTVAVTAEDTGTRKTYTVLLNRRVPVYETANVLSEQSSVTEGHTNVQKNDDVFTFPNTYERRFYFAAEPQYFLKVGENEYVRTENAELTALSEATIEIGAFGSPKQNWYGAGFIFRSDGTNWLSVRFLGSTMLLMHNGDTLKTVTLGKAIAEGDILDVCVLSEPDSASVWLDGILVVEDEPIAYRYPNRAGFWIVNNSASFGGLSMRYLDAYAVNPAPSGNANLSDLSVFDTTVVNFTPDTCDYVLTYDYRAGDVLLPVSADIDYEVAHREASAQISEQNGVFTVTVTAEDGTQKVYTITLNLIYRQDADLIAVLIGGEPLAEFTSDVLEYSIVMPMFAPRPGIDAVTYTLSDAAASATVSADGDAITIAVTAQDGQTQKTYTLIFILTLSDNAGLSDILINGISLNGFDSGQNEYTVNLPANTFPPELSQITFSRSDANASVIKTRDGNTAVLTVTAQNGIAQKIYRVTFIPNLSSNADLASVTIGGAVLTGVSGDVTEYTFQYAGAVPTAAEIEYTLSDATAVGAMTVEDGKAVIKVTALDGTVKTYTITFEQKSKGCKSAADPFTAGRLAAIFGLLLCFGIASKRKAAAAGRDFGSGL
ncbi:MAG: cadherin-like beta sandwich domain-containing protein [Clostridiales bacterium]|jgi:nitrogen fixation protein FixH|nr:cadherin-like beta sandwich domain-containing protein [Clostridiales bacterium]